MRGLPAGIGLYCVLYCTALTAAQPGCPAGSAGSLPCLAAGPHLQPHRGQVAGNLHCVVLYSTASTAAASRSMLARWPPACCTRPGGAGRGSTGETTRCWQRMPRSVKTIHMCQSVGESRSSLGSLLLGTHLVEFSEAQTGCTAATAEITLTACQPGQVETFNLRKLDQSILMISSLAGTGCASEWRFAATRRRTAGTGRTSAAAGPVSFAVRVYV